jgi:hypothetical protein
MNRSASGPVSLHRGALCDRSFSSYSHLSWVLEGGEWLALRPGRPLPPVPTVQEAGWAPLAVWTQRLDEKLSACVWNRTPAVQTLY